MKKNIKNKGIVLYVVLGVIIIVTILTTFMFRYLTTHASFSSARINRNVSYYVVRSVLNYGYDRLTNNDPSWLATPRIHRFCNSSLLSACPAATTGVILEASDAYPLSVRFVDVTVSRPTLAQYNAAGGYRLDAHVVYTAFKD